MLIALFMGIRRGELAGLEWKDIDFENNIMKIQKLMYSTKGLGYIIHPQKSKVQSEK